MFFKNKININSYLKVILLKICKYAIPFMFLIVGLFVFCFSMIIDLQNMPGDIGDARFINYTLEHGFLFLKQAPLHDKFWSPPIFWPFTNMAATTDILLGGMLIYSPIRLFVSNHLDALQIYFVILNILNFVVFYIFSRKILKLENFHSSIAAYFFAFCLPRYIQTAHLQLFLQFYMVFPLFFLCLINSKNNLKKNLIYFSLACFSYVLLAYSSFYFAWYFAFGILLALLISVMFSDSREKLKDYLNNYHISFLIPFIVSLLLFAFLIHKFLLIAAEPEFNFPINYKMLLSSGSLLDFLLFSIKPVFMPDSSVGIGIFMFIFVAFGFLKIKYKKQIFLFILFNVLFFNFEPLQNWLFHNVIFFKPIRAVARYIFLLIPVFAVLIAYFFKNIKNKFFLGVALFIFLFAQIPLFPNFSWTKEEHIKRIENIYFPSECTAVGLDINSKYIYHDMITHVLDVMWYANYNNKYTSNGYGVVVGGVNPFISEKCTIKYVKKEVLNK